MQAYAASEVHSPRPLMYNHSGGVDWKVGEGGEDLQGVPLVDEREGDNRLRALREGGVVQSARGGRGRG